MFKSVNREEIKKNGFPEPIPLSKEILRSLSKAQMDLLSSLGNLAEVENKVAKSINEKMPTESGVLGLSVGVIAICEDEDDWLVITAKERQKQKFIRQEIAQKLSEALDLGLGPLGFIQRQCKNYKVEI